MDEFNPYKPPEAPRPDLLVPDPDEGRGVWSDGPALVMSRFALLPSRCVRCNAPASHRLRRKLSWYPREFYFLFLLGPIGIVIYLVVYLAQRQRARVMVPLCPKHRARRTRSIALAWLAAGVGVAAFAVTPWIGPEDEGWVVVGAWIVIGAAAFGSVASGVVWARKIDKSNVWLRGVGPAYLASLTPLPRPDVDF